MASMTEKKKYCIQRVKSSKNLLIAHHTCAKRTPIQKYNNFPFTLTHAHEWLGGGAGGREWVLCDSQPLFGLGKSRRPWKRRAGWRVHTTPHHKQTQSRIYPRLRCFIYPQVNKKKTHTCGWTKTGTWHYKSGKLFVVFRPLFAEGSANRTISEWLIELGNMSDIHNIFIMIFCQQSLGSFHTYSLS